VELALCAFVPVLEETVVISLLPNRHQAGLNLKIQTAALLSERHTNNLFISWIAFRAVRSAFASSVTR
jgi:hypothetical protein